MNDVITPYQVRGLRTRLNQLRMPELRNILMDLNLARSGRKSELVDRIANELEHFADKAQGATSAPFYVERLSAGMRSIEMQTRGRSRYQPASQVVPGSYCSPQVAATCYTPMVPTTPPTRSIPVSVYGRNAASHVQVAYASVNGASTGTGVVPLTSGVDLYHPTKAAALDGARCFCAMSGVSGKVVKCVDCGLAVHAKCHQLVTLSGEWYCELCRSKTYDPFYRVQKTVLDPTFVRFAKPSSSFRLEYYITDNDLNKMYANRDPRPGSMTPGSLELQLRCFVVKDDLGAGHCWPASTQLSVNGFGVPITQRAPPGHANPSKVLRELPGSIFQYSRVGRNVVDIRSIENPSVFGFMVQIVEVCNINDIVNEIKEASKHRTYDSAKQDVIKSFGSEDENDVVATVTMLSVRCPLGLCVINLPARGLHCKHLQCFDLKTFLLFSKKARSKAWRCTVCYQFIKAADLRIDPYLKQLLAEVEGEDELEEVEIFPDGSWKRRLEAESVSEPSMKKVKAEQAEVSTLPADSTLTFGGALVASTGALSEQQPGVRLAAPVEIDLLCSDDEVEEDTASKNASSTAAASIPIVLDDDIDILTVNSDVWDTPAAPALINNTRSDGSDGNCGEYFPFPLDENLFPSIGSSASTATANTSSSWMYSVPASTIVSSIPPPTSTVALPPLTTVSPLQELLNQAESNLASSMASLSRHHNVNNPFDQQQRRQVRPLAQLAANVNDMDIICLLDSDSE